MRSASRSATAPLSSGPSGTVRASLGHYNTGDEIDRLGHALDELVDS